MGYLNHVKNLIKNQYAFFTITRYTSYFLQFIRGFIVAKVLGPELFGIWGLILLYQQYLSMSSLGIQYSLNAELALSEGKDQKTKNTIITSSFMIVGGMVLILLSFSFTVYLLDIETLFFSNNLTLSYITLLLVVIAFQNFQQLFNNVFRINQQLFIISLTEVIVAFLTLLSVFFFNGETLILAYLIVWALSLFLINIVFLYKKKFQFTSTIPWYITKQLIFIGIPLLIYNFSFQLMMLASRTLISYYYSLEILGFYSLAHSISITILLGLDAMGWVFFPRVIARVKEGVSTEVVINTIKKISGLYSFTALTIIYSTILISPLIFLYLPKYIEVKQTLDIMLLTQGVFSFGYSFVSLAISRKKNKLIALISLLSCAIVVVLGFVFCLLHLNFYFLALASMAGSIVFTYLIIRVSFPILKIKSANVLDFIPLSMIAPLALFIAGIFLPFSYVIHVTGFIIFLWINRAQLVSLLQFAKEQLTPGKTISN